MAWAARRGDARVTNLQHDGIVVEPPAGLSVDGMATALAAACEAVLGYPQPVEQKPLGEDVSSGSSTGTGAALVPVWVE